MSGLARNTDPSTSRAAIPDESRLSYLRYRALQQFGAHRRGLIPDEVEDRTMIKGIWRRCSDLKNEGLVEVVEDENGPITLPGRSGKCGEMLRITDKGVEVLEVLEENPPKPRRARNRVGTKEQRILDVVDKWMQMSESTRGFGTTLTRGEKQALTAIREIRAAYES